MVSSDVGPPLTPSLHLVLEQILAEAAAWQPGILPWTCGIPRGIMSVVPAPSTDGHAHTYVLFEKRRRP